MCVLSTCISILKDRWTGKGTRTATAISKSKNKVAHNLKLIYRADRDHVMFAVRHVDQWNTTEIQTNMPKPK